MTRLTASGLRSRLSRPSALWAGFLLAALAAGLALNRLYQTARFEIAAQSTHALQQERIQVLEEIHSYVAQVRHSTIGELAAFHVDGLSQSLRKWDDTSENVVGTFEWEPTRGLLPSSKLPRSAPDLEELARLWKEFRTWRSSHLKSLKTEATKLGRFHSSVYPTTNNPEFSPSDLGYQSENLDILAHANRPIDPWAGWAAAEDDAEMPWIFWYQSGPDDTIRGCFVDVKLIASQLRHRIVDTPSVRHDLIELRRLAELSSPPALTERLSDFPAYALILDRGDLFDKKESSARLAALTAAMLFGMFILGGIALALYTRREKRDAERKITFVGQVSHELRTPLTSIRMYADLLAQPELLEVKRLKFAQTIGRESARLGTLVERLLTLNELERGDKKITCGPVDLSAVINETVEERKGSLETAGLGVEVDLPATPVIVSGDHSTLKQALLNLLENAEKYAREGKKIQIKVDPRADPVLVEVSDFGPGIPHSIRLQLFEPFVQGNQSLTNKSPGVGLGLSIARGTLRRMGGDLVLLPSARGARFQLRLPSSSMPGL